MINSQQKSSAQIQKEFGRKAIWFYIVNTALAVLFTLAIYFGQHSQNYREVFIFIIGMFLLWIFNVDKIYRCPNCGGIPRGKEGLIYLPKRCAICDVTLRE